MRGEQGSTSRYIRKSQQTLVYEDARPMRQSLSSNAFDDFLVRRNIEKAIPEAMAELNHHFRGVSNDHG